MKKAFAILTVFVCLVIACITACVHKPQISVTPADGNYPADVAKVILNKCATAGCHDQASYQNADGLLLDTWEHLFNGGVSGAEAVAYSPLYSPLLYYCNTNAALGVVATDPGHLVVPIDQADYMTLYNWIENGAPDKNGNIPFATNPDTRRKIYMTQQGCDLLTVIDAASNQVMRYIPIGADPANIESPHCVRVSSDGLYAYVSFLNGNYIQKIDTRTDKVVSSVNVGSGSWNMLYLSPMDTALVTTDWVGNGQVVYTNTAAMQTESNLTGSGSGAFVYPHGITSNATFDTTFITAQYGNVIYKYAPAVPYYKKISLNSSAPTTTDTSDHSSPDPHDLFMVPDYSRYFVSCESTNEVRVMDAHNDQLLATIPVGTFPQELAISNTQPYMFVTCQEDAANPNTGCKGSVYVINYNTYAVVKILYGDFYQPHGITVDDKDGLIYIPSRNANPNGPAPHHSTSCAGRPGWYTIYNLNTLTPLNTYRYDLPVDPYSAAVRFK